MSRCPQMRGGGREVLGLPNCFASCGELGMPQSRRRRSSAAFIGIESDGRARGVILLASQRDGSPTCAVIEAKDKHQGDGGAEGAENAIAVADAK